MNLGIIVIIDTVLIELLTIPKPIRMVPVSTHVDNWWLHTANVSAFNEQFPSISSLDVVILPTDHTGPEGGRG